MAEEKQLNLKEAYRYIKDFYCSLSEQPNSDMPYDHLKISHIPYSPNEDTEKKTYCIPNNNLYFNNSFFKYLDSKKWTHVPTQFWFHSDKLNKTLYRPVSKLHVDYFGSHVLSKIKTSIPEVDSLTDRLKLAEQYPEICPKTYVIRNGNKPLIEENRDGMMWFLKENYRQYGTGVKASKDVHALLDTIDEKKNYVLQEHIPDPLLIDGHKFHIRIYLLFHMNGENEKCKAYIYKNGIIAEGDKEWSVTSDQNQVVTHRRKDKFNLFNESFPDYKIINAHIGEKLKKTIRKFLSTTTFEKRTAYELLGLDFMLDRHYKPYLLEMNPGPVIGKENDTMIKDLVDIVFNDTTSMLGNGFVSVSV